MCVEPKKNTNIYVTVKPHLREERNQILSDMQIKHNTFVKMIDGWDFDSENDFTKDDMRGFPIMEWMELKEGVKIRRRNDLFGDILCFDTIIEKGVDFGMHMHSDCDEICDVKIGKLSDLVSEDGRTYSAGETLEVKKGVKHIPIALEYTELLVYFH